MVLAPSVHSAEMEALLTDPDDDLEDLVSRLDGPEVIRSKLVDEMDAMDSQVDMVAFMGKFMDAAQTAFDTANRDAVDEDGISTYIECHRRTAVECAMSEIYYDLRHLNPANLVEVLRDEDKFPELSNTKTKVPRLVNVIYKSRREARLSLALSLSTDREHVDTGGGASNALHEHECWRVFCEVMERDGYRSLDDFVAPATVIALLNKEFAGRLLLGGDYQLRYDLCEAASLLGSPPKLAWKALQQIAKAFGFKSAKQKVDIGGVRNCFASVHFSVSDTTRSLVKAWTIYDGRCSPHRRVPVDSWHAHCEQHDHDTIERLYTEAADVAARLVVAGGRCLHPVGGGGTLEVVNLEALSVLCARDRPPGMQETAAKVWDAEMSRVHEMFATGDRHADGTLTFTTTYRRNHTVGRDVAVNSLRSLQGCPKRIRGLLTAEYSHDLDMENCHYLLMVQIADQHDVDLKCVRHYVDNRAVCLQEVRDFYGVTRKAAKDLFLSVLNGGAPWAWMRKFDVDDGLRERLQRGHTEHLDSVTKLQAEYEEIRGVIFRRYRDNVDSLIAEIKSDDPIRLSRWTGHGTYREKLPAETEEGFEKRAKRSAFSNLLQNEERLCLNAMVDKLTELGYEVGCKIYDGCLIRRKKHMKLPADVIVACEAAIKAKTGLKMPLWEKCLLCGEKLKDCACPSAQIPCIDCGEIFVGCMCECD